MKKPFLWVAALLLLICMLPAAQAAAEPSVPDFASFSGDRFVLTAETDYGFCTSRTYEAPFTESSKANLEKIMTAYKNWFMNNPEMSPDGEHSAAFGRFGDYTQETSWYSCINGDGLSAFSLNLIDVQPNNCHVLIAFKEYEDKFGLDMYLSSDIALTEYVAESFVVPDLASYLGSTLLGIEEINGLTVYKLPQSTAADALYSYFSLLETNYGFSSYAKSEPDALNYVWFEEHETIPSNSLADLGLEGESCFTFAFAVVEGEFWTILYPADGIIMEDTGERYQTDAAILLPDFTSFAGDHVLFVEGDIYSLNQETGIDVLSAYSELLENEYGLSSMENGIADGFLVMWYTDCPDPEAAGEMIYLEMDDGMQAEGYFYIIIGESEEELLVTFQYSPGMAMTDNGERYTPDVMIPMPAAGDSSQEKLTIPMLEAFMSDAVKEILEIDGVTYYRVGPECLPLFVQYGDTLADYGVAGTDESDREDGFPFYAWFAECEQDLEPETKKLHGSSTDYYMLVTMNVYGGDFLIATDYADCLNPVDTGDRWDGATLTAGELPDSAWYVDAALASAPAQPAQPAAPERELVSEPADASDYAHTYSPDTAFMQDLVTYCAGRLSYDAIDSSSNYMVRDYKGSKDDYQLVKDYVDMLVETNPYLELQHFHEETYTDTFYSFAIDYTGNVNLGPQADQTYTDNTCDIMLYGTLEGKKLELSVWTPANVELVDLGMRYGGGQADVSIGGESALAGLYRNADGTFETTDGRFWVAPGEAMVLRDGFAYTTEATFDRDDDGNRDRIWMRYFYRNETLHFSYPTRSLMTGDLFRLSDLEREDSWLLRDRGIFEKEKELTSYRWDGPFLGVNHDGDWMTPINDPTSSFTDATVRVMYMDEEIAVFYIYAEYTDSPLFMEALCAVPLTDQLTEDEIDYTTYAGQSINVSYEWTEFGASYELFDWEIISGGDLASVSNETSKTCTLTAHKPGLVGLRVTYNYGAEEPNVLTGNPSHVSRTKTQDYTIMIK